jgi:hypothetical protein
VGIGVETAASFGEPTSVGTRTRSFNQPRSAIVTPSTFASFYKQTGKKGLAGAGFKLKPAQYFV